MNNKCGHFNINDNCSSCLSIQSQWYKKIKTKGFEDIEGGSLRLIKKWTGVSDLYGDNQEKISSIIDLIQTQAPNESVQSSWPEIIFKKEEELLNHKSFEAICENLFRHGNNAIKPKIMVKIWKSHCEGFSLRQIEKQFSIHYVSIFRAVRRLGELIKLMDLDHSNKEVVIRPYSFESDSSLIYDSWKKQVWFENHKKDEYIDPVFSRKLTKKIKSILESNTSRIRMACLKDDPNHIVGYSVMSSSTIEFVYVKIDFRKQGIATILVKGFMNSVEPSTKIGAAIAKTHDITIKENEYESEERKKA